MPAGINLAGKIEQVFLSLSPAGPDAAQPRTLTAARTLAIRDAARFDDGDKLAVYLDIAMHNPPALPPPPSRRP